MTFLSLSPPKKKKRKKREKHSLVQVVVTSTAEGKFARQTAVFLLLGVAAEKSRLSTGSLFALRFKVQ